MVQSKWTKFYFLFFSIWSQSFVLNLLPKDAPWNSLQEYKRMFDLKIKYGKIQQIILWSSNMSNFLNFFPKKIQIVFHGYTNKNPQGKIFSPTVKCALSRSIEWNLFQLSIYYESTTNFLKLGQKRLKFCLFCSFQSK